MNDEQVQELNDEALVEAYKTTLEKAKADKDEAWESATVLGRIALELRRRGLKA
jgi:hypothetical protein